MITRYSRPLLTKLWSEETRFQKMLEVEKAVAKAYHQLAIMPEADWVAFLANAHFDYPLIKKYEEETKHDVIAFLKAVGTNMGAEKKWLHFGLTSTDAVDTAQNLILQAVNVILSNDLHAFLLVLKNQALKHKMTPCIGRTHGMHAEVTSFGLKWASWYAEMERNLARFTKASALVEVGMISGAVGNYANVSPEIEKLACTYLNLAPATISTQVIARDIYCEYLQALAMIATTLEKIALQIRLLSQSEIGEVAEAFACTQKGSSAMPHKRNPIASENICGLARVVRSNAQTAYENNLLWHERDISHSSSERIILADSTTLVDYMLNRYQKVLSELVIDPARMLANIDFTKGLVYSGQVVNLLTSKGVDHDTAYDLVQSLAFSKPVDQTFQAYLLASPVVNYLTDKEIASCFTNEYYLKQVDYIYHRLQLEVEND